MDKLQTGQSCKVYGTLDKQIYADYFQIPLHSS